MDENAKCNSVAALITVLSKAFLRAIICFSQVGKNMFLYSNHAKVRFPKMIRGVKKYGLAF